MSATEHGLHWAEGTAGTKVICLTDDPEVVELKREFRRLDEEEQNLKLALRCQMPAVNAMLLHTLRGRKSEIASKIFQVENKNQLS
jgi:hypothetical protein